MRGASKEDAAARDPPRVNSALIRVYINGQELLALLDTGCEVDLVSEETARRCNLPVHSLAQSLRLRFADGRQNAGNITNSRNAVLQTPGEISDQTVQTDSVPVPYNNNYF